MVIFLAHFRDFKEVIIYYLSKRSRTLIYGKERKQMTISLSHFKDFKEVISTKKKKNISTSFKKQQHIFITAEETITKIQNKLEDFFYEAAM